MKVGAIGTGFVGQCVVNTFSLVHEVKVHDVKLNTSINDVLDTEIVFINVPTPSVDGKQDYSIVEGVIRQLQELRYAGTVVIKSTVLPGSCRRWEDTYGLPIVHNPEFLTERNAQHDFDNQEAILLSGSIEALAPVAAAYRDVFPDTPMYCYNKFEVTEMGKYIHNDFLATKVAFMNEMYDLCQHVGCDYNQAIEAALSQKKILPNHTRVPGPDGQFGFGGSCFPKDVVALLTQFSDKSNMKTLQGAYESNKISRAKPVHK
jgi:nucleotide sugar dehydrogenase